jgi:hypothetical protein
MIKIWSLKKDEESARKRKPKTSPAQLRVQKGAWRVEGERWRGRHEWALQAVQRQRSEHAQPQERSGAAAARGQLRPARRRA